MTAGKLLDRLTDFRELMALVLFPFGRSDIFTPVLRRYSELSLGRASVYEYVAECGWRGDFVVSCL